MAGLVAGAGGLLMVGGRKFESAVRSTGDLGEQEVVALISITAGTLYQKVCAVR
jgi:hypothetical protein